MPSRKSEPSTAKLSQPIHSVKHAGKCASITTEKLFGFGRWVLAGMS